MSSLPVASQTKHTVKVIAFAPGGGLLAGAVGVELSNRGFTVIDSSTTSSMMIRLDLNEIEVTRPEGLAKLREQGIDALLVVRGGGGYPNTVRTDNGPEFTSRVFMAWAQMHGIRHILIQPERPMQNGYVESFNGKFRDEHLNESWFETLQQARNAAAIWKQDYWS